MKIITALKKIKHLDKKIAKNQSRIAEWASYFTDEDRSVKPTYNSREIEVMFQQIKDWLDVKMQIRHALHLTNLTVTRDFENRKYTLDELLLLQNVVIPEQITSLKKLQRKQKDRYSSGRNDIYVHSVVQFDAFDRDKKIDALEDKKTKIDEILDSASLEEEVIGLSPAYRDFE